MRRKSAPIRKIIPDAKYNNVLVSKFINYLMIDGKRSIVEKNVYVAFDTIEKKNKVDCLEFFKSTVEKITPKVEVRSKRVGGANYQVPMEVLDRRGLSLALRWMKTSIKKQNGRSLSDKIFKALMEIENNIGWACKKKEEVFRMAEANKAFAHFAWTRKKK